MASFAKMSQFISYLVSFWVFEIVVNKVKIMEDNYLCFADNLKVTMLGKKCNYGVRFS